MTKVEDFWSIKKIAQTHKFEKIRRNVVKGTFTTPENITFLYNNKFYLTEFQMYFNYDSETKTLSCDKYDIYRLSYYNNNPKEKSRLPDAYYNKYQRISSADLSDMNDPLSNIIRASKYAISNLFELNLNHSY